MQILSVIARTLRFESHDIFMAGDERSDNLWCYYFQPYRRAFLDARRKAKEYIFMSQDPSFSSIPGLNGGENAALSNSSLCHLLLCRDSAELKTKLLRLNF